ncbi:MAG TPA: DUF4352 domain-containing protein [Propionibacteriaceae bacterium]|nr:DUF4352 domain-containing protein [Propionibacteriaceae bacterium]
MAEPEDEAHRPGADGMGSAPHGPSFLPWSPAPTPEPHREPVLPHPIPGRPAPSRLPTLISIVAIGLVAAVVVAASLIAFVADQRVVRSPRVRVADPPSVVTQEDRIDFISSDGTGQLIMLTRSWVRDGRIPPSTGTYLRVEVELICATGQVDYDPYNFQAFDQSGRLFEMAVEGTAGRVLSVGTLRAGERTRGVIAFDMPRGEATLMMSDDADQTVTALKVPN